MAVMTKSFAPDFEMCATLNRSVLDNTPHTVHNNIMCLGRTRRWSARRSTYGIRREADLLARTFVPMPFSIMVNLARRSHSARLILQQVIKLAAMRRRRTMGAGVDPDAEFIRPFTAEMFVRDGKVRFFCKPSQIDKRLPRHMTWHRVARALLGWAPAEPPYLTTSVASCLGPDDRQADVGAGRGHYGAPLDDCDCWGVRLLGVRALWRVRRCRDRCVGQRVCFGRLALPGLLAGHSAEPR